jgi:hypothetical protein
MRLTVVGNPDNRRVRLFAAAARAAGLPPPAVLPWREVAAGRVRIDPATVVRVDSPGEDAEVDRLLSRSDRPAAPGEIRATSRWYAGFVTGAHRIAAAGAPLLSHPDDLAVLFDKRRCHAVLAGAGVGVPQAHPAAGWADVRAAPWPRLFVKPAHGSSASGVLAVAFGTGGRVCALTSVEYTGGRLYNSLRVRRYDDERTIASIVDSLAPDGLHVERWYPKAGYAGRTVDLRVVVIAGRPTHVVVRASRSPMTNLHLGNARGDVAGLKAAVGARGWAAAMATCEAAAALFPRSLHVGVDLMFAPGWRRHAVAEVNAFGDLLPGLLAGGRDTYAEEVDAIVSGRFVPCPA